MSLKKISSYLLVSMILTACGGEEDYTPKPRGYFRISTPEAKYEKLDIDCPFTFDINSAAEWQPLKKHECWGDVYYPSIKARLQLTYKPVTPENLDTLLSDGHELAFKHVVKADGIAEKLYSDDVRGIHGILYNIRGEAATNTQFFVTDSAEHFLRGVLYFYAEPNEDSLRPVNDYMYQEVVHLIETLQWQNSLP